VIILADDVGWSDPSCYHQRQSQESARNEFFHYGEHDLFAIRYRNWKIHFQTGDDWFGGQLKRSTVPLPVNLRVDPFEQHMTAPSYPIYVREKLWTVMPAGYILQLHAQTFAEFPPRQAPPDLYPIAMLAAVLNNVADGVAD
jgi:arylsulfatase